jgi:hypothetical protein
MQKSSSLENTAAVNSMMMDKVVYDASPDLASYGVESTSISVDSATIVGILAAIGSRSHQALKFIAGSTVV